MTTIQIDISDALDDESAVMIAPDVVGNAYELSVADLVLTVSHAQMDRLYQQIRPWFEEETT
ncbi:MAG: hypothetical protein ABIY56_09190 [Dokdonella sp.]